MDYDRQNRGNLEDGTGCGYGLFGFFAGFTLSLFSFLFLCCPDCTGITAYRGKSFIIGATIGTVLSIAVSVLWIFSIEKEWFTNDDERMAVLGVNGAELISHR